MLGFVSKATHAALQAENKALQREVARTGVLLTAARADWRARGQLRDPATGRMIPRAQGNAVAGRV